MSDLFKGVDISWKPFLEGEFQKDYMKKIKAFLVDCSKNNRVIYPPVSYTHLRAHET